MTDQYDEVMYEWMERHGLLGPSEPENPFSPAENEPDESWETYLIREGLGNGELLVESPRSVEDVKATITEAILEGVKDSSIAYTLLNNSLKLVDWQAVYDTVEYDTYGNDDAEIGGIAHE